MPFPGVPGKNSVGKGTSLPRSGSFGGKTGKNTPDELDVMAVDEQRQIGACHPEQVTPTAALQAGSQGAWAGWFRSPYGRGFEGACSWERFKSDPIT